MVAIQTCPPGHSAHRTYPLGVEAENGTLEASSSRGEFKSNNNYENFRAEKTGNLSEDEILQQVYRGAVTRTSFDT